MRAQLHKALLDLCFERGLGSVSVADLCRRDAILAAIATATDGIEDWRERMRVTA